MNIDNIIELKKEIISNELGVNAFTKFNKDSIGIESIDAVPRPDSRLSVGFSPKGNSNNDFFLEIRVQRVSGSAYKRAEKWKEKAKNEANIMIIEEISIPPLTKIRDEISSSSFRDFKRPLEIGSSISSDAAGTGSIGAFVEKNSGGSMILTNNHVIANYDPSIGRGVPVYQPGRAEGSLRLENRVASLHDAIVALKKQINYVDAATALLDDEDNHNGNIIPSNISDETLRGREVSRVANFDDIQDVFILDNDVYKIGRSSGFTKGKISALSVDGVPVRHPSEGIFMFNNVFEVSSHGNSKFSLPGDSGSLVFSEIESELVALGLHFAGGEAKNDNGEIKNVSYFCPMNIVLKELDLKWI